MAMDSSRNGSCGHGKYADLGHRFSVYPAMQSKGRLFNVGT